MMRVEIVLDEDKIRAEGKYDAEKIKQYICNLFDKNDLRKVETSNNSIVYCDKDKNDDYTWLWQGIFELIDETWIAHYINSWIWIHNDNIEDIIEVAKKVGVGAFA